MTDSAVMSMLLPFTVVARSKTPFLTRCATVDWLMASLVAASCWVTRGFSVCMNITRYYHIIDNIIENMVTSTMFPTSGKRSNPLTANHLNRSKMLNVVRLYASLYSFRFGCNQPTPFFP